MIRLDLGSGFAILLLLSFSVAQGADQRPNILLVMADDMGWTDLGCFGSEIETPHLDALAQSGVKFTDFHVSVSCSPTRSMLLSGNDNHIAGLGNMGELITPAQRGQPGYEGYLNDRVVSLAEVLHSGGYHTYMAGKWHLGHKAGQYPCDRGFERAFSLLLGGASHFSDQWGLMEVESPAKYSLNGEELKKLPADFYSSQSYTDFLIHAVREHREDGKPFFAYLAFTAPHDPIHVPEPWLSKYRGQYDEGYEVLKQKRATGAQEAGIISSDAELPPPNALVKPWKDLNHTERAEAVAGMEGYAGMIENMDYHLGRMVNFLKDIDRFENTIVIFLSDNGSNPWYSEDYPGNRGSTWYEQFDNSSPNIGNPSSNYAYGVGWASASSGPLDYFKMAVGEGGIRSPTLIAGPGIKGGRQVDSFAYVWDLMPTILELADVDHPQTFQGKQVAQLRGKSLRPVLSGNSEHTYPADSYIGGEMGTGKWMRKGNFKAVSVAKPYGSGQWQLFDLSTDPGETHDLSQAQPALLQELQGAWTRYAKDVGVVGAK